jgi:hypothetical protein
MIDSLSQMPFVRTIGLFMTYKCQIICPHCIVDAGPHRMEELSIYDAFDWIDQISVYRNGYIRLLALTGGEPFYNLDKLNKISSFAKSRGLITTSVTNAYWADEYEKSIAILQQLPALNVLAISTDIYHQKFIPFDNVTNATKAAESCGIPCYINTCTEDVADPNYLALVEKLSKLVDPKLIIPTITIPLGRATQAINGSKRRLISQPPESACLSSSSPVILPDGKILACTGPLINLKLCHPLFLGNLRRDSLTKILDDAESNAILHALRIWGPGKLISMAREAGLGDHLPKKFLESSACSACYSLFSSPKAVEFLAALADNSRFQYIVANTRAKYFNETKMMERLNRRMERFQHE